MNYLSLDIGKRRTGVAILDVATQIPMPLSTIAHRSEKELIDAVITIIRERNIDHLIVGLPLLLSGVEGEQSRYVRNVAEHLRAHVQTCDFLDERYTTPDSTETDGDASAACALLTIIADRQQANITNSQTDAKSQKL